MFYKIQGTKELKTDQTEKITNTLQVEYQTFADA